jgi:FkbM family methyltransferase
VKKQLNFPRSPNFLEAKNLLSQIASASIFCIPRSVNRPIVLYGAGDLGRMAREYFEQLEISIEFVVDKYPEKSQADPFWEGLQIIAPNNVELKTRKEVLLVICVVTSSYIEITEQLYLGGWTDIIPFYDIAEAYRDRHPLSNGWFATPFSANDIEHIEWVLERWADDVSRAHHLQFIAWRRLREEWLFADAPINTKNRFFIPEILSVLTKQESFVDIGAYVGSVSQHFIEVVDGCFQKIWLIEPDSTSLLGLEKTLSQLSIAIRDRITVIPVAVGSQGGERNFFQGLGYASQCSELGQRKLMVRKIDSLNLSPTFMKFHLEGAELDALKGAYNTISQYRPIIAVTSYHNHEGLWMLPQWLMNNLPNYRFYMRLHSWCGTGAVVYALSKKRF